MTDPKQSTVLTDDEMRKQAWNLYALARARFAEWDTASPKADLRDKRGIQLSKQIEAARNAWLACGGHSEVVIGER